MRLRVAQTLLPVLFFRRLGLSRSRCHSGRPLRIPARTLLQNSVILSEVREAKDLSWPRPVRVCSQLSAALIALAALWMTAFAPAARAEYVVLRSGQRLVVTGYQLIGDKYKLQMAGGTVEVAATEVMAIEPEEVFTPQAPKPTIGSDVGARFSASPKAPFRELVDAAAARYSIDADLVYSVMAAESNFDPKAISRRNARGLMQLMPETALRLGVKNIFDPKENIDAGTRYLGELLARYNNDLVLTLAAYNAGPERIAQYGSRVPPFPETQSYVRRVKQNYAQARSASATLGKTKSSQNAPSAQAGARGANSPETSNKGNKTNDPARDDKSGVKTDQAKPQAPGEEI